MRKEDFKIEIIEENYSNNFTKFIPSIYREYNNFNLFEKTCNKLIPNCFKQRRQYYSIIGANGLMPSLTYKMDETAFTNLKQAVAFAETHIDTYLKHVYVTKFFSTKTHKIN